MSQETSISVDTLFVILGSVGTVVAAVATVSWALGNHIGKKVDVLRAEFKEEMKEWKAELKTFTPLILFEAYREEHANQIEELKDARENLWDKGAKRQ